MGMFYEQLLELLIGHVCHAYVAAVIIHAHIFLVSVFVLLELLLFLLLTGLFTVNWGGGKGGIAIQ